MLDRFNTKKYREAFDEDNPYFIELTRDSVNMHCLTGTFRLDMPLIGIEFLSHYLQKNEYIGKYEDNRGFIVNSEMIKNSFIINSDILIDFGCEEILMNEVPLSLMGFYISKLSSTKIEILY